MLDLLQIKQHRIAFSILAILAAVVIVLFIALFSLNLVNEFSGKTPEKTQNTMTFTGEGKVYAKPDIAIVDLSVVTEGKYIKDVQDRNTKKMNGVIDFLKSFGIEEKDIKTTNYNIYPKYVYQEGVAPWISGYEISQAIEVKIRNLEKVGEILEKSVGVGINQVNSLRFWVDKDDDLKAEAQKLAIEDAKKKARETAARLGIKLGKLIGFYENSNQPYPIYNAKEGYGIGGGGETPNIQVGENEIYISVSLTYKIE
jgi:hypothetical protein